MAMAPRIKENSVAWDFSGRTSVVSYSRDQISCPVNLWVQNKHKEALAKHPGKESPAQKVEALRSLVEKFITDLRSSRSL
jgi:hypothetical protein